MQYEKRLLISSCLLALALFMGCASRIVMTGKVKPISTQFEKYQYRFTEIGHPSTSSPYLKVLVERQAIDKKVSEKEFRQVRSLSIPGWALTLGTSGALIATGKGQIGEGKVVLGRDLIALGALITPAAYFVAHKKGEPFWEKREDMVAHKYEPLPNRLIDIKIKGTNYSDQIRTNEKGELTLTLSSFVGLYRRATALNISLALADEPTIHETFTIPWPVMAELADNPEYLLGEEGKSKLPPYPETSLKMFPQSGIVPAGGTISFKLSVENRGKGAFYRLLGIMKSQASFLTGKKFYLGKIEPGSKGNFVVSVDVPLKFAGGDVPFEITFSEHNDYIPDPIKGSFYVEPAPRPQLTYSYQIIDDNSGNSVGNGDGKIQKGEAVDLLLTVKNIGTAEAKGVKAKISAPVMRGLEVNIPESDLGTIGPGDFKSIRLTFGAKKTMKGNKIPITLNITEEFWNFSLKRKLSFPLEEAVAPQILTLRREVVVNKQEANIHGGADEGTPVIAKVPQGGILLATGQLGSWFRVELAEGIKGWVKTSDVGIKRVQITDKEADAVVTASKTTVIRVFEQTPPAIAIFSPESDHVSQAAPTIELAGLITDDKSVDRYEIRINGRHVATKSADTKRGVAVVPLPGAEKKFGNRSLRFKETISLDEGLNSIVVLAWDSDGLTAKKEIVVERTKKLPEIWAVVVGISDYMNTRDLNFAANDAQAFYDYLVNHLGVPQDHVQLFLNEQATLGNVKKAIGDDLRKNAGKEDQAIIFFAGHGAVEDDPSSPDGDGLSKYLVLYDTKPDALYSTALAMDEIGRVFGRIQSDRVVYIGDTCYSGGSGGRTILTRPTRATLSEKFLDRLSRGKGRIIITASGANEISLEDPKLHHGIFTYYLLNALKGEADYDGDGFITVDEAYSYLSKVVPQSTGQVQHPVKKGEVEGVVVLGRK